jgi:hypothetical protein
VPFTVAILMEKSLTRVAFTSDMSGITSSVGARPRAGGR